MYWFISFDLSFFYLASPVRVITPKIDFTPKMVDCNSAPFISSVRKAIKFNDNVAVLKPSLMGDGGSSFEEMSTKGIFLFDIRG